MKPRAILLASFSTLLYALSARAQNAEDPYIWLEDVQGERALSWVRAQNDRSTGRLTSAPGFNATYDRLLAIYNDTARIPYPSTKGDFIYNFWQDGGHERGVVRRTTLASFLSPQPDWETVLDVDALAASEGRNWVYKGSTDLHPDYTRSFIRLSNGGADAVEHREFDRATGTFVTNGFRLPEGKSNLDWIDLNTVYVGTDFGPGSMTTSGYPRIVKRWKRGTPLESAETIFEGESTDVEAGAYVDHTPVRDYHIVYRSISFWESERYYLSGDELVRLELPKDAWLSFFNSHMLVSLNSDWRIRERIYPSGSIVAIDFDEFLNGGRDFSIVVDPDERSSVINFSSTRDYLLVNTIRNVRGELYRYRPEGREWKKERIGMPEFGSIHVIDADERSNDFFITYTDYLTPATLYRVNESGRATPVRSGPSYFEANGLTIEQQEAISTDGARIPYFIIHRRDIPLNGTTPTILYGYGGFRVALTPNYDATVGTSWLEDGGAYVVANIRGGDEFGPAWHEAARKQNRQRAYDDFIAVAEDLIGWKITSPEHLGVMGGSNGGLLVGVAFTQRPDLFNAAACMVPLLDMKRYHMLLAGASWMGEYGDPDVPEEWDFIRRYSPYHNLSAAGKYPEVFFVTSTRDDRVHPGHARKMAARMEELGHPFLYYENIEGGHAGAANHRQTAYRNALIYTYFRLKLGLETNAR